MNAFSSKWSYKPRCSPAKSSYTPRCQEADISRTGAESVGKESDIFNDICPDQHCPNNSNGKCKYIHFPNFDSYYISAELDRSNRTTCPRGSGCNQKVCPKFHRKPNVNFSKLCPDSCNDKYCRFFHNSSARDLVCNKKIGTKIIKPSDIDLSFVVPNLISAFRGIEDEIIN